MREVHGAVEETLNVRNRNRCGLLPGDFGAWFPLQIDLAEAVGIYALIVVTLGLIRLAIELLPRAFRAKGKSCRLSMPANT